MRGTQPSSETKFLFWWLHQNFLRHFYCLLLEAAGTKCIFIHFFTLGNSSCRGGSGCPWNFELSRLLFHCWTGIPVGSSELQVKLLDLEKYREQGLDNRKFQIKILKASSLLSEKLLLSFAFKMKRKENIKACFLCSGNHMEFWGSNLCQTCARQVLNSLCSMVP